MQISAKISTRELTTAETKLLRKRLIKAELDYFVSYHKPILDGVMQPAFIEVDCDGDDSETLADQLRNFIVDAWQTLGTEECVEVVQDMEDASEGESGVYWVGNAHACHIALRAHYEAQQAALTERFNAVRDDLIAQQFTTVFMTQIF